MAVILREFAPYTDVDSLIEYCRKGKGHDVYRAWTEEFGLCSLKVKGLRDSISIPFCFVCKYELEHMVLRRDDDVKDQSSMR